MPLLKLTTSVNVTAEQRQALLPALSKTLAKTLGKPEQYVMIALHSSDILFGGQADAAAFADVRSIGGLDSETNARLAREVSQILHQALGIPPARVFLNFTNVEAGNWGWNGDTFG